MKKDFFIILFSIIILASFLRLFKLGSVPASPDWDEVSLGYNAYSILETGKDEYGKTFPIVLRSFDDYKPALYSYLAIPFIKLLGLNIIAVRLPSAIFGILTVMATYFLVLELFKKNKIALLTSFLLSISPWHLQFSRIGFESNVGLAFNVFSVLFFLKGLKKPLLLLPSVVFMGVSLYIYQSEKVFIPLLLAILVVLFKKELFSLPKKYIFTIVLLGILISLPIVFYTITNKEALSRAKGVSVFSEVTPLVQRNSQRIIEDKDNPLGIVFYNRRVIYSIAVVSGYLSHFDLNWLFIKGDLSRNHASGMGLLYLIELPFLFIGIYALLFSNFNKRVKILLFGWFIISFIPASVTSGVPHAVRTLSAVPIFTTFSAIGIYAFFTKVSKLKWQYLIYLCIGVLFGFNFLYYLDQYFIQQNYFNSKDWQYGYKEAVEEVKSVEKNYKKIIVSNQPYMEQSYMFFLFYLKYPASLYQQEAKNASGGFRENHQFGKFEFRPIQWDKEIKSEDVLYIGRGEDFPAGIGFLKTIHFLNGEEAIKIVRG